MNDLMGPSRVLTVLIVFNTVPLRTVRYAHFGTVQNTVPYGRTVLP